MDVKPELFGILEEVLSLRGRSASFDLHTPLLGAVPELDSMAVISVITTIEERFGLTIGDDEVDAATFTTVGTLVDFVSQKIGS